MTALRTLAAVNKSIETTQSRISTGLKVGQASDNAAYWSIATTMRSDHKALGTAQDALGLGAATVDVAYTAMEASKDVLDEMKAKFVAAKQPGVDKAKIQSEIGQLQEQLEGIASAATFSGNNWLSGDSSASSYTATASIVSGFSRDAGGNVSVGTIDLDVSSMMLFDASASQTGLLEGTAAEMTTADFTWTQGSFADGDLVALDIAIDGGTAQQVRITVADAANFSLDALVAGINEDLTGATARAVDGKLVLSSETTGANSSVEITSYATGQADTTTGATIGFGAVGAVTGTDSGGALDIDITSATQAELDTYINQIDTMSEKVVTAAADLGAIKSRIDRQADFAKSLMDAIDRGVGQLVDADMGEESTRLQSLQVQQQLAIQSLSIANSNSQTILSLFR